MAFTVCCILGINSQVAYERERERERERETERERESERDRERERQTERARELLRFDRCFSAFHFGHNTYAHTQKGIPESTPKTTHVCTRTFEGLIRTHLVGVHNLRE